MSTSDHRYSESEEQMFTYVIQLTKLSSMSVDALARNC